jgi:hypothetical protein
MVVELPYTLHTRYASIAVAWTIILIPPIFINLGLFYGLWYGTDLDRILGSSPSLRAQREKPNHVTTNKNHSPHPPYWYSRDLHNHRDNRENMETDQKGSTIQTPGVPALRTGYLSMGIFRRFAPYLCPHFFHSRARGHRPRRA